MRWSRVLDGKDAFRHESLTTMLTEDVYADHSVLSVPNNHSGAQPGLPRNLVVAGDWGDVERLTDPAKNILIRAWTPSPPLRQRIATTRFAALPR